MCGLAAAIGDPDAALLRVLFDEAGKRGPHAASAAAWIGGAWSRPVRHHGPLASADAVLVTPAPIVVAHSRLATCGSRPGDLPPLDECQPFIADSYAVAHNGRVPGSEERVDSMTILTLWADGTPLDEAARCCAEAPSAVVASDGARLWAYRHAGAGIPAQPLFRLQAGGSAYVGSRRIPGAEMLPADTLVEVRP